MVGTSGEGVAFARSKSLHEMGHATRVLTRVGAEVDDRTWGELTVTTINFVDRCPRKITAFVTLSWAQTC
jgi:hypothetical protein